MLNVILLTAVIVEGFLIFCLFIDDGTAKRRVDRLTKTVEQNRADAVKQGIELEQAIREGDSKNVNYARDYIVKMIEAYAKTPNVQTQDLLEVAAAAGLERVPAAPARWVKRRR